MKTLDEHNAERWERHASSRNSNEPRLNGIECPKCGKELFDSSPMVTLTSDPPQKDIHCEGCGYRGYRLA